MTAESASLGSFGFARSLTIGLLGMLAMSCNQAAESPQIQKTERVALDSSTQDERCRDTVANSLAPGAFAYGVVVGPSVARQVANSYFMAVLPEVKVDELTRHPVKTELRNGVWHVETTIPEDALGGGLSLDICQSNGRVLKLTAEQ